MVKKTRPLTVKKYLRSVCVFTISLMLAGCQSLNVNRQPTATDKPLATIQPSDSKLQSSGDLQFSEMTIPSLRKREYISALANLQKHQENDSYTSYVTSYQSDNLKINALLTIPKGDTPQNGWPAIVFVHGYIPPMQYRTTEKYEAYVNFLARNGFVVLKTDLRGHGNSEGEPGGGYYSADYVIDTLNARAALQSTAYINKDKIGLWGHSMAGNVLLRAFVSRPEIPAVVIWAGAGYTYTDLQEYRISDASYRPLPNESQTQQRRKELYAAHGQFDPTNSFWKQVVPTNYLVDLKGTIQLHHAEDDNVVNIKYSQNLNTLLDQAEVPHSFYSYKTGGHNISGTSFTVAMQRTVELFKQELSE